MSKGCKEVQQAQVLANLDQVYSDPVKLAKLIAETDHASGQRGAKVRDEGMEH